MTDGRQWGPVEQRCGTCRHYQPTRNPDTGRVLTSKAGSCGYEVRWPELPMCYCDSPWNTPRWPEKHRVWPGEDATKCAMWEQNKEAPRRKAPKQEVMPL